MTRILAFDGNTPTRNVALEVYVNDTVAHTIPIQHLIFDPWKKRIAETIKLNLEKGDEVTIKVVKSDTDTRYKVHVDSFVSIEKMRDFV